MVPDEVDLVVKPSVVPFLDMVSDTVAASSSLTVVLAVALALVLANPLSAAPVLPVQLFWTSLPFTP